ncbi:MAG: FeoB-associated Cys-rich membrane protein [Oscillospiraceae bacterium]|nr:FeoB-associated Cys-rich membrane protein [Oscillospiraceae bacterium]
MFREECKINFWDVVIFIIIAGLIALAVILRLRKKNKGSACCGDCACCKQSCKK